MAGSNDWSEGLSNLEALGSQWPAIERKALRAVADVIKPRLVEATPTRISPEHGGNSLAPGELKASVRAHIRTGEDPPGVVVDFGRLNYIANAVDSGHRAPHARALTRAGVKNTGKPTPAHPFVRSVQDSSQAAAQTAFEEAMSAEINKVLHGE